MYSLTFQLSDAFVERRVASSRVFSSITTMSNHSTTLTSTATHTLLKYSRSYASSEWQHFVNPVIKLLLEVKKSSQGELTSFRLRILWFMGSGNEGMDSDQREVSFVRSITFPPYVTR